MVVTGLFSACSFVGAEGRLTASARVQLLPAGEFRSLDGAADRGQRLVYRRRHRRDP
jgi:phage I-like protein